MRVPRHARCRLLAHHVRRASPQRHPLCAPGWRQRFGVVPLAGRGGAAEHATHGGDCGCESKDGAGALEIRLLRRGDRRETVYQLNLGSTGSALRWHGSESNTLSIRGQIDRSDSEPRALTTVLGGKSLRKTLCEPHGSTCAPPHSKWPNRPTRGSTQLPCGGTRRAR